VIARFGADPIIVGPDQPKTPSGFLKFDAQVRGIFMLAPDAFPMRI
jgi:hypothetical protein